MLGGLPSAVVLGALMVRAPYLRYGARREPGGLPTPEDARATRALEPAV